jgi:anti-sigma regulatory factor (Ser/Thr protein kinase)
MRAAALAHAVAAGMPEARAGDVVTVVHELAGNAVRHGAGRGRLRMWSQDGILRCMVEDGPRPGVAGDNGDGGRNAAAGWPYQHGHGLWLVRLLAHQVSIVSGPGGTRAAAWFALSRQRHPSEREQPLASRPGRGIRGAHRAAPRRQDPREFIARRAAAATGVPGPERVAARRPDGGSKARCPGPQLRLSRPRPRSPRRP